MSYVLAIDVGTSFTAAAIYREGQGANLAPEILPLGLHGSAVPSVLYYADDGRVLVGEAAERRGLDDPQRMVREFKRRIGDSVPIAVGDGWLAPEDVYATMARWVVDKAKEREGGPAESIVMTHPAAWGQHRTSMVLAALNLAGLSDVTLITEPEAAALHYASQTRVEDGSVIAVYDLGGGTFDTAVLRKAGAGHFELLGHPDGIETLGGADFDAAVLRHVVAHLGEAVTGLTPEDPATLAALSRLRRECREAKEALSLDSEASISVSLPGTQQSVRLVRSEFEDMIEPHIRETLDALERSLAEVRLQPEDLSVVLLIGGSSRVPLVAELISVELERPIAVDADPKASICLGAALSLRGAPDAQAAAPASAAAAAQEAPTVTLEAVPRPDVVHGRPALSALKAAAAGGARTGRHAPRSRVRMAAAAAAAATVLTVVTATAAQSPEVQALFGSQAADVMRDGGAQASAAQPGAGQGGTQAKGQGNPGGAVPSAARAGTGLEASAKGGATRTPAGSGQSARKSPAGSGTGSAGTGSGTAAGATSGTTGGTTTPGASTPGTGTGTATPGTSTPSSPPASEPGGAAGGPTPPPSTQPPVTDPAQPPVTDPAQPPVTDPAPPPVTDPSQPPVIPTPADPPPTTTPDPVTPAPVVPAPEPTFVAPEPPPGTQDPVPSEPVTEPSAPVPPEPSQSQEPAPASVV